MADNLEIMRTQSQGVVKGQNVMGNLFSLSDMLTSNSVDMEKVHERQIKLKSEFTANVNEMKKKLKLIEGVENVVLKGDATFRKENDVNNFGLIILTEFRFIFQFLEKNSDKEKFKEDFFKIPYILIEKITKGEQKSAYIPFTINVRDGRKLLFYLSESDESILKELNDRALPKKFDVFEFPKMLNDHYLKTYTNINGWNIYDFKKEFLRQGLILDDNNCPFRISEINKDFKVIDTYPQYLVEPRNISDDAIKKAADYRTKKRVPTLSYYFDCKKNGINSDKISGVWRSSQSKSGFLNSKNKEDINLINEIKNLGNNFFIYDARPYINAASNKVKGGGFEDVENYECAKLIFCDIENIHKARDALKQTEDICTDEKIMTNKKFWSQFEATGWLDFIMITLKITTEISRLVSEGNNVLIHCSDGWDRTPQLVAMSQVLLDPYYRTFMGFAVLVEKDFLSFGHQFAKRSGISEKKNEGENERSPIFLQFLDCIFQLMIQFPTEFEFNAEFLLFVAKHYNVNLYGTFLYNNEKERSEKKAKETTASIWTYLLNNKEKYGNPLYSANNSQNILKPNFAYYSYKLWTAYFMRNSEYAE